MSERPVDFLLEDVREATAKIFRFTRGMTVESFAKDEKTVDAVVRNLEIMGEAANRLPVSFKREHPEIEWAKIVGLRHRIVHEYFGVDIQMIWHIVEQDLPVLRKALRKLHRDM